MHASDCCFSSSKQDWLPWSLLLFSLTCDTGAFYVPGVAPINFHQNDPVEIKVSVFRVYGSLCAGPGTWLQEHSEWSCPSCGCRDHRPAVSLRARGSPAQSWKESTPAPPTPGAPQFQDLLLSVSLWDSVRSLSVFLSLFLFLPLALFLVLSVSLFLYFHFHRCLHVFLLYLLLCLSVSLSVSLSLYLPPPQ